MTLFLRLSLVLLFAGISTSFAQKNYFYGSFKIPAGAYIESALENQDDDDYASNRKAGVILDLGYGIGLNRFFALETGAELFLYSPATEYYDYSVGSANFSDNLDITHQAISLQLRPVFNLDLDESTALKFALAFNYQKMITNADYYSFQETETEYKFKNKYSTQAKADFAINLQPSAGIFFHLSDRWALGLDLSYVIVDWNKTLDHLKFSHNPDLNIRRDKTSTVYAAIKVIFR